MLHVALLAAAIAATPSPSTLAESPIQRCLATMDGAIYNGDPSDLTTMKAAVRACENGRIAAERIPVSAAQGPAKLFIVARLLDRSATLTYMGLGDASNALTDVRKANLYFRVAAGLPDQAPDFHSAALANVELTSLQLQTLRTDIASRMSAGARTVALRPQKSRSTRHRTNE